MATIARISGSAAEGCHGRRLCDDVHTDASFCSKVAAVGALTSTCRHGKDSVFFESSISLQTTFQEVITITSSSPPREVPLDSVRTARNTASGSSLPTPQAVSHEVKKSRTAAAPPPMPTASSSAMNSGPTISSFNTRPPLTPSRPRSKLDHIPLVHRTTPHSQRIVPSSQWSDDEQSNSTITLEANRDPFLLHRTEESDSCLDDMTLPPPSEVPSSRSFSTRSVTPAKSRVSAYPTFTGLASGQRRSPENDLDAADAGDTRTHPLALSGSSRSVLFSSSGFGRSYSSQIEPTSQIDEIELKLSSQRLFVDPILPLQPNQCDVVPSVARYSYLLFSST